MSAAVPDPRHRITPDAFAVAPHLLGLPLARPWRRALALAVDLLLIAVFLTPLSGFLLALAAAASAFWLAARARRREGARRREVLPLRLAGVLLLLGAGVALAGKLTGENRAAGPLPLLLWMLHGEVGEGAGAMVVVMSDLDAVRGASTPGEASAAVHRTARDLRRIGQPPEEIRETLEGLAVEIAPLRPHVAGALFAAADSILRESPPSPTPLARAYVAFLARGDTAAARVLYPRLLGALGADTVPEVRVRAYLEARVDAYVEERESAPLERAIEARVQREVAQGEGAGGVFGILDAAEELGLDVGWAALYFTVFLAVWGGRTPGKRLLGIRVVRLNGKPVTWWTALERFGGYAAGLATGLLGFIQVFWDRNRQAIQDKIIETVVVRDSSAAVEASPPEVAEAQDPPSP